MTEEKLSHERIEGSFTGASEVIARLPDSMEKRRAADHLEIAADYAHQAHEQAEVAEARRGC